MHRLRHRSPARAPPRPGGLRRRHVRADPRRLVQLRHRLRHGDPQRARGRTEAGPLQAHRRARARPSAHPVRARLGDLRCRRLCSSRDQTSRGRRSCCSCSSSRRRRSTCVGWCSASGARARSPLARGCLACVVLVGVIVFVSDLTDLRRVPLLEAIAAFVYALVILWMVGGGVRSLRPRADLAEWTRHLEAERPAHGQRLRPSRRRLVRHHPHRHRTWSSGCRHLRGCLQAGAIRVRCRRPVLDGVPVRVQRDERPRGCCGAEGTAQRGGRSLLGVVVAIGLFLASPLVPVRVRATRTSAQSRFSRFSPGEFRSQSLGAMYGSVLIARDRQIDVMRNSVVVAAFVVIADLVAVLAIGLIGAAIVSVFAGVLAYVLNRRSVRRIAAARPLSTRRHVVKNVPADYYERLAAIDETHWWAKGVQRIECELIGPWLRRKSCRSARCRLRDGSVSSRRSRALPRRRRSPASIRAPMRSRWRGGGLRLPTSRRAARGDAVRRWRVRRRCAERRPPARRRGGRARRASAS